jgi:hypothetical protein
MIMAIDEQILKGQFLDVIKDALHDADMRLEGMISDYVVVREGDVIFITVQDPHLNARYHYEVRMTGMTEAPECIGGDCRPEWNWRRMDCPLHGEPKGDSCP